MNLLHAKMKCLAQCLRRAPQLCLQGNGGYRCPGGDEAAAGSRSDCAHQYNSNKETNGSVA